MAVGSNELNLFVIFRCGNRGQPDGQPVVYYKQEPFQPGPFLGNS